MAANSSINWTDITWNAITGCTRVSEGCRHCYIERTTPFRTTGRRFDTTETGGTTGVDLHPNRLDWPLKRWKKPAKIFVNSLSDMFHEAIPTEYIAQVFAVMAATPHHTYQLLTKRHARMRSLLSQHAFWTAVGVASIDYHDTWPPGEGVSLDAHALPNVWLGVSVEDQKWAGIRIPALRETPAAVRWVSAEPLLGEVTLRPEWLGGADTAGLDWIVAGGESGPGARPMDEEWVRSLLKQCEGTSTAPWVKQLGSVWAKDTWVDGQPVHRLDQKGENWDYWPADLRVREFPGVPLVETAGGGR